MLAGLVTYPPDSPVAIAHARLWSVVPQCGALLLSLGMSEAVLSEILSGLLGLVSFQALALVCYALGRNAVVAIGAPLVIFVSQASNYGIVYPIALLASPHLRRDRSVVGRAVCRSAGGRMAPHRRIPSCDDAGRSSDSWRLDDGDRRAGRSPRSRTSSRAAEKCTRDADGRSPDLVSFGIHRALAPPVAAIDAETASRFFRSFVTFWDWHRQPVPLTSRGVMITAESIAVAAVWLAGRPLVSGFGEILLWFVAISGAGGIGLAAWSSVFTASMPDWVLALMPGRLINVNILMAAAVLAGLLAAAQQKTVRLS